MASKGRTYRVKQVAEMSGLTVRTLHHYDAIGLLSPSARSDSGYRLYSDEDLRRLQQIVLAREMGLELKAIRTMLDDPAFDPVGTLESHRQRLLEEHRRIDSRIRAVDAALASLKGEGKMDPKKLFEGFDPNEHEDEARERWGGTTAYEEAARRTKRYRPEDWKRIKSENDALMRELAAALERGLRPDDQDVRALAEAHREHLDRWYYPVSPEMHAGLAEMYVADERFRASFDRYREGLADFLADAIRANLA